jgi:hypothetical protein
MIDGPATAGGLGGTRAKMVIRPQEANLLARADQFATLKCGLIFRYQQPPSQVT